MSLLINAYIYSYCPCLITDVLRQSHITNNISVLQQNATAEDLDAHIDIADWLIRYKLRPPGEPVKKHCVDFLKAARYISPEYHGELEALIEDLNLEYWGVERIEKAEEEIPP